jgi:hypothetical protein
VTVRTDSANNIPQIMPIPTCPNPSDSSPERDALHPLLEKLPRLKPLDEDWPDVDDGLLPLDEVNLP